MDPTVFTAPSLFSLLFSHTIPTATYTWLSTTMLTGASLSAGMVLRSLRHRLIPRPVDNFIGWRMPFRSLDSDGATIVNADGSLTRLYHITGIDSFMKPVAIRGHLIHERRETFNMLATYNASLTVFRVRTKSEPPPAPTYPNPVIQTLFERYYANYKLTHENRTILLVNIPAPNRRREVVEAQLKTINEEIMARLHRFRPTLLHAANPNPAMRPLATLAALLNPIHRPGVAGPADLQWSLFSDRWQWAKNGGLIRFVNGQQVRYGCVVSIRQFNGSINENMSQQLEKLPCEAIIAQAFKPVGQDRLELRTAMKLKRDRSLIGQNETARDNINVSFDELDAQVTGATTSATERNMIWTYNMVVVLFSEIVTVIDPRNPENDPAANRALRQLDHMAEQAQRILSDHQCAGVREGQASYGAWYALWARSMNGYQPREWWLTSDQAAHSISFEATPTGYRNCDWGDGPPIQVPTYTGSSHAVQFHVGPRQEASRSTAHGMIIGPTEAGKTTTMTMLLAGTTRFPNHRVFCTDRQYGLEIFTKAVDGRYITFDGDVSPHLNPLDIDDPGQHVGFLVPWLARILDIEHTDPLYAEIAQFVDDLYALLPDRDANRTLRTVASAKAGLIKTGSQLAERFLPWTDPGTPQGQTFNAKRDTLDAAFGDNQWVTFDFTDLYQNVALTRAVIPYIAYKIAATLRKHRQTACIFLDEATSVLSDAAMLDWFRTMHREYRKRGIAVLSAFQDIPSLHRLGIMDLVEASLIQTIFFLPNPQANDDHYKPFKLTEREMDFIRTGWQLPRGLLLKRYATHNTTSVALNVDFSGIGEMIKIMASDDQSRNKVELLHQRHGPKFLQYYLPEIFGQPAGGGA
jgi:type IV secretion system protein VirB4